MTEKFDPFKNAKVAGDIVPRRISRCTDYESPGIPAQVPLELEDGSMVEMSYERALALGLIGVQKINTVLMYEWSNAQ